MDFQTYQQIFDHILTDPLPAAPYNNPDYHHYVKLNQSRSNRWLKNGVLSDELVNTLKKIGRPQQWIIITEPWCGDASHILPFLHKMTEVNPLITVDYELRDSAPFRIHEYLTNGGKAIPKLVVKNEQGDDLFSWGPRPAGCQQLFLKLKEEQAPADVQKIALQKWYNEDNGSEIQSELLELLRSTE